MEMTWMAKGNCADRDPKIFFPSDGIGVARAKSICSTCPVQAACLEHALTHRIDHGVWGWMFQNVNAERFVNNEKKMQSLRVRRYLSNQII